MTNEEFKVLLEQLFPAEINGIKRPDEPIPADVGFGLDFPEWIRMDPLRYDLINAVLTRALSNDAVLKSLIEAIQNQLANCDLRLVTQALKGLMSPADKQKLDGIATGANAYSHPNSGIAAGTYKSVSVDKQGHVTAGTNPTTLAGFGITDAAAKEHGAHVPTKETADNARFLRNDNTWQTITPEGIGITNDMFALNLLQRNKSYTVGDIAYSKNLPSWARLECVHAGTTGADEPDFADVSARGGLLIIDGTAVFIVDDIRDYLPIGTVIYLPILRDGYVKANGAEVLRSDYPRLVLSADKYNLWTDDAAAAPWAFGTGDGSTTMTLPDYRGRAIQGGDNSAVLAAGLPNIEGAYYVYKGSEGISRSTGAFTNTYTSTGTIAGHVGTESLSCNEHVNFKASLSNAIYGASATVQPPAIQLIPQIKY